MSVMINKSTTDTIFAIATAPGRAGVAVIRVSGPRSFPILEAITRKPLPAPRQMVVRRLFSDDVLLDEALVVRFEKGRSFTGDDMVELHVHGGRATAASVIAVLSGLNYCRSAAPGEFTRRALENGRLDLAQVEGLADLIDAETEAQREQAMALMKGELSDDANRWRQDLIGALALLEASIDFADEEDAPVDVSDDVAGMIAAVLRELEKVLEGAGAAERIRDGFVVALVGPPNAGKSSLLNALIGREAAIASPVAGTTRDIIEAVCDFDGIPVILTDMAGIRETGDEVEGIGVDRALQKVREADLRIFLTAPDIMPAPGVLKKEGDIEVFTKSDLARPAGFCVSVKTGEGLHDLRALIGEKLKDRAGRASLLGRERQKVAVQLALNELSRAREETREEICAALLRSSIGHLSGLLGEVGVEDILDDIFSRFCMGK